MKFGIFYEHQLPRPWDDDSEHRLLKDALEQVELADKLGYDYVWEVEHHFLEEYSHLSANEAFLGWCAAATERLHVGSGIFNITPPVNHPFRTAEKAAMLDLLSGGRFELGMGRGSSTTEQRGFGIDAPDLTRDMFDEVLPELVRMWAPGEYPGFEGEHFSAPARTVLPKPLTDPHPPLWVAAGSPSTFAKAARLGLGVLCFTTGPVDQLAPLIEAYKREVAHAEPVGGWVNDNVMVTSSMLCLEDSRRARELIGAARGEYHKSLLFRYLDTFPRPADIPEWPEVCPPYTSEEVDLAVELAEWPIGDPEEVSRSVQRWVDAGADQLVFGMMSQELPAEVVIEATELFGREVIPRFDTDPEHRTTRLRREQVCGTTE